MSMSTYTEPIIEQTKPKPKPKFDKKKYIREYKKDLYHNDPTYKLKVQYQHKKTYYKKQLKTQLNIAFTQDIEDVAKHICQALTSLDKIQETHQHILLQILTKYQIDPNIPNI